MEQQSEPTDPKLADEVLAAVAHVIVASAGKMSPDDRSLFSSKPVCSAPDNAVESDPIPAD